MSSKKNDSEAAKRVTEAKEAMEILTEMSQLLNTGLDSESLSLCVSLCEMGVNPEALAAVVREIRRETATAEP